MHFSKLTTFTSLALFALTVFIPSIQADNNPDDPNGKSFYVTQPSCDYYKCQVKTQPGGQLKVEWIHPQSGNVDIFFNPEDNQKGLKTYKIASKIPSNNDQSKCGGKDCGMFNWKVPSNIKPGNYSVEIHSLSHKKSYGYSDIVTVQKSTSSTPSVAQHKNETSKAEKKTIKHHKNSKHNSTEKAEKKSQSPKAERRTSLF